MPATIGICLATFNGARFLQAQLDSIAAQTHRGWKLYVRDDGSNDGTGECVAAFAARHPDRVVVIRDGLGRLGPLANFARLMEIVPEPYVAFSDQDDVWRPARLARSLSRLRALEARVPAGTPAMVHADRRLIDARGAEIAPSYWRSRGLDAARFDFGSCLSFCLAAGSTMLVNRPLLDLAVPVPPAARMHDCWVELLAHAFGVVDAIDEIALDHRRHGKNASGPGTDNDSRRARRWHARALRLWRGRSVQRRIAAACLAQAAALLRHHGPALPASKRRQLEAFVSLPAQSFAARARTLSKVGAMGPGPVRMLAFAALATGHALPAPACAEAGRGKN